MPSISNAISSLPLSWQMISGDANAMPHARTVAFRQARVVFICQRKKRVFGRGKKRAA